MEKSHKFSLFYILPLMLIFIYILFNKPNEEELLDIVIKNLLRIEQDIKVPHTRPNVAVGFTSCIDILSHFHDFINNLNVQPPLLNAPTNYKYVNTKEELVDTFLYYFKHGASTARIIYDDELFAEVLAAMELSTSKRIRLGGNAHVMSKRLDTEGADVFLMASISQNYRNYVPNNVHVGGNMEEEEELHLILEYEKGDIWGGIVAPRANRFMIYKKSEATRLPFTQQFLNHFDNFQPQLLVLAGFRLINNTMYTNGHSGIENVVDYLDKIPALLRVHVEMSSFEEMSQIGEIVNLALNYADSVGMNEQELPKMIAYLSGYTQYIAVHDSQPSIEMILDKMRLLMSLMKKQSHHGRILSRIHLHTLSFQVIMIRDTTRWNNTRQAAAKSVLTAYRHTCGTDSIQLNNTRRLFNDTFLTGTHSRAKNFSLDIFEPVICWVENEWTVDGDYSEKLYQGNASESFYKGKGLVQICVVVGIVCKNVVQTVGGGDNVSAATLLVQILDAMS